MEESLENGTNILRDEDILNQHTTDDVEFEKDKEERDNFKILISPFSKACTESASYDLRIGGNCTSLTNETKLDEDEISEKGIQIDPNETVIIRAKERIGIPLNCTALVTTKISLAKQGVLQITSRIDPGYVGPIDIVLFNSGINQVILRPNDRFANLVFFKIGVPPSKGYDGQDVGGIKGSSPYKPISIEDIMSDENKESAINTLLERGPPFDYVARLIQKQEGDFNLKIEEQKRRFGLSLDILKVVCAIAIIVLTLIIGAKVEFVGDFIDLIT